jgi:transposase IS204/IS1001/IS1096/IS1165 family protein
VSNVDASWFALLSQLNGVELEAISLRDKTIRVLARSAASVAACPGCRAFSRRVHSRYERRLADAAIGGREVIIHLRVGRFLCGNWACERRTFAEQVGLDSTTTADLPSIHTNGDEGDAWVVPRRERTFFGDLRKTGAQYDRLGRCGSTRLMLRQRRPHPQPHLPKRTRTSA